jgi:formylglycine-generating enzyme required for sulfatase activity
MTEAEWLACTRTNPMLRFSIGTEGRVRAMTEFPACKDSDRKLRLFGTHKVLRGGARMTRSRLSRDTRRNSYQPDRRDARSGFRTRALRS